jgi:hypothetical protein
MCRRMRFLIGTVAAASIVVLMSQFSKDGLERGDAAWLAVGHDADSGPQHGTVVQCLSGMPLSFTENRGQWNDRVLFRADMRGATMWFTRQGANYQFTRCVPSPSSAIDGDPSLLDVGRADLHGSDSIESIMISASFVGANPNPDLDGEEMLGHKCNYFIGNDPERWRTDVPNFRAVRYREVYAGIDLRYYGNGRQIEYDFVVSPGADASLIQVRYDGAKSVSVNAAGGQSQS